MRLDEVLRMPDDGPSCAGLAASHDDYGSRVRGALDPQTVLDAWLAACRNSAARERPEACAIRRVHFGSAKGVVVEYSVVIASNGARRSIPLFGHLPPTDYAASARKVEAAYRTFVEARPQPYVLALAPVLLDSLGLILRPVGLDERIDGLWRLSGSMRERLGIATQEADSGLANFDRCRVVAHRLGKRAVVELQASGTDSSDRVLMKCYKRGSDGSVRTVRSTMRLAECVQRKTFPIRLPRILATDHENQSLLMEHVPGRLLGEEADGTGARHALAGSALACLHQADVEGLDAYGRHDELDLLQRWARFLARTKPSFAEPFGDALSRVEQAFDMTPRDAPCVVHRDFHDKQIIMDGATVSIIDFDTLCLGEPAQDIGNFLAHAHLRALQSGAAPDVHRSEFLRGYLDCRPLPDRAAVDAHERAAYLRLAAILLFSDDSRQHVPSLLALAEGRAYVAD